MADQSYFGAIVAAVTIFITLTVLTTAFRVYIKVFVVKQYGWEECLSITQNHYLRFSTDLSRRVNDRCYSQFEIISIE